MKRKSKVSKRLEKQINELLKHHKYDEAIELIEPFARNGDARAQYNMGRLLYHKMTHREGVTSLEETLYWLDKRIPKANEDVYPDLDRIIYWYEEAAKQNHAKAIRELAGWYMPGPCDTCSQREVIKRSPSFTLQCDLEYALSLYVKAFEAGEDTFSFFWLLESLLERPRVPQETKGRIMDMIHSYAKNGNLEAANALLNIWKIHYRCNGQVQRYDMQIDEHELLHTYWFQMILDDEIKGEKEDTYTGHSAIRLLQTLAKDGNQEALDKLTEIGMEVGGQIISWVGDIHYQRQEYELALKCFQMGGDAYRLGKMYELGEGTAPDAEKAFHYYEEAEDHFNMGRMYEQGIGTKKNLQKAFERYQHIVSREICHHPSYEEENKKILSARRAFRRLKKVLFAQKDEIALTVLAAENASVCSFSFASYGDCLFTIDWGDGQVEEISNEKGEEIHLEHNYTEQGKWDIRLKSDETHTITAFYYTCGMCTLQSLDVTRCPVLADLFCVSQNLRRLNVSRNPRLERLVCRGNKLQKLNIWRNNRLTQLDYSDNPLYHLNWNPRYSALSKVCLKNTINLDQLGFLDYLLKNNKGERCDSIMKTPLAPVFLPLSYYARCTDWSELKAQMQKSHAWAKHKAAFDAMIAHAWGTFEDKLPRQDLNYTEPHRIICEGGYTYFGYYDDKEKEFHHQDFIDVQLCHVPWSDTLAMPVEMREHEGWMMLPLTPWADVFCPCFEEMTYSHWKETEEIVQAEREFWERLRKRQEEDV